MRCLFASHFGMALAVSVINLHLLGYLVNIYGKVLISFFGCSLFSKPHGAVLYTNSFSNPANHWNTAFSSFWYYFLVFSTFQKYLHKHLATYTIFLPRTMTQTLTKNVNYVLLTLFITWTGLDLNIKIFAVSMASPFTLDIL